MSQAQLPNEEAAMTREIPPRFALVPHQAGCMVFDVVTGTYRCAKAPPRYQWALDLLANLFGYEAVRLGLATDYGQTETCGVFFEIDGRQYGWEFPLKVWHPDGYRTGAGNWFSNGWDATDMPREFVEKVMRARAKLLEIKPDWSPANG